MGRKPNTKRNIKNEMKGNIIMKKMKKLIVLFIALCACVIFSVTASAERYNGTCGDNVNWALDTETGVLTISGTGAMAYYSHNETPWYDYSFSIASIIIEDGVTRIGDYAFEDCDSLISITVDENNEYYSSDEYGTLFNKDKTVLIQYPIGNSRTKYTIPDSVTNIERSAFESCDSLVSIEIPDSVISIGEWVFGYCSNLESVTIPNGITRIENYTFICCYNLESVTIPNSVTSIGEFVFDCCTSLTNMTIPDSVTSIEESTFLGCSSLTSITIPKSVTNIKDYAFLVCESLTDVYYTGSEEDRNNIYIGDGNGYLTNATWHYNYDETNCVHNYITVITAPTCTEKGYTTYTCSCGDSYIDDYVESTGHTEEIRNKAEATCTVNGYTGDTYCSVCGELLASGKVIPANGHNYITVVTAPTCTEKGYTTYTCSCGDSYVSDEVSVKGHSESDWIIDKNSTCSAAGSKHTECTECKIIIATQSIEKLPHSYTSVVTAPTCTEKGYTKYTCKVCYKSYTADEVSALGHNYSKVVTAPTCTEKGYTTYTCKVCTYSYTGDSVNAKGHSYGGDNVCDNCGKNKTENCKHLCHKSGIIGFIWKIIRFFFKLFKINPVCSCGAAHY